MLRLKPFLERLTIQTKELQVQRLRFTDSEFAWAQVPFIEEIERQYNAGKPVRIIVLKARQLGISTITEGVLFNWGFIHPGTSSLVIAHESDASQSLFEKTQMYWETWPFKDIFHTRHSSQRRLTWQETGSTFRVATAKNMGAGRSRTIHAVHASECAFWENAEVLMTGLSQTIPEKHGTIVVLESTANGVGGWFYDTWNAAVAGENDYIPLFFPWIYHPEYAIHDTGLTLAQLTGLEKDLYKQGADLAHIAWRRWMIPNKMQGSEDSFRQEYPATPDEAFLTSGRNVFPLERLADCYDPKRGSRGFLVDGGDAVRFKADPTGPITLFKTPSKDRNHGQYFIGADPVHTTQGDNACAQVLNRRTLEQVAVWHGKANPLFFADQLMLLGQYFYNAEISCEIEGPGNATISRLITMGYTNIWRHRWADKAQGKLSTTLGWSTNYNRKHWMIGNLVGNIADQSITIHDAVTYNQLRNYVIKDSGEMGNGSNVTNDDAVMALGISLLCSQLEGPVSEREPYQIARRLQTQSLEQPDEWAS